MQDDIKTLKRQLQQLRELHQAGALPQAQYDTSKAALERRLLDAVLQQPAAAGPSRRLIATLAGLILLTAGAGYWWAGSPGLIGTAGSAPAGSATGEAAAPHATDLDQMSAMVDRLAERLRAQPEDGDGWAMLARSYAALGRHPQALQAYEKAIALRRDDPELMADYADALAVRNNRQLAGEPMQWVERALKRDPRNLKALALAGTHAYDRQDYAAAARFWQQVVDYGTPDNSLVQQIQGSLAQARELAGLPPVADAGRSQAPAAGRTLEGAVSLAPALRGKVSPDDTVFIYARAAQGSRMPLAIVRRQVRDLPYRFTLDDSTAMAPGARLSDARQLIVEARISKSGNAMPEPGDLTGQTGPVSPGATALRLEIRDTVKP